MKNYGGSLGLESLIQTSSLFCRFLAAVSGFKDKKDLIVNIMNNQFTTIHKYFKKLILKIKVFVKRQKINKEEMKRGKKEGREQGR